jgi:hypothetical protein
MPDTAKPVYHLVLAAAKDQARGWLVDPYLSDEQWRDIPQEFIHRLGLAPHTATRTGCGGSGLASPRRRAYCAGHWQALNDAGLTRYGLWAVGFLVVAVLAVVIAESLASPPTEHT